MDTPKDTPNNSPTQIDGGFTLWARQTIDSEIFSDKPDKWFKIWFYLVNKANYKDNRKFKRGQALVTYEKIADATGATKDQIKHCIEFLKARHMIATKKATRGMYVTILNYDTYQNGDNYKSHTESQTKATQKPHRSHTKKKKEKKEKKYSPTSNEVRLSTLLLDLILENKPDYRLGTPAKRDDTIRRGAVHIDRLIRLDGRTPEQVEAVIHWAQQDDFWWKNILSGEKLRKQFDKLEAEMQGKRKFTAKPLDVDSQGRTQGDIIRQQLAEQEAQCR